MQTWLCDQSFVGQNFNVVSIRPKKQFKFNMLVPVLKIAKIFVMLFVICCHLYNFEKVKNTHGVVLLLVKVQAKVSLHHGLSFTFLNLPKWYQITQNVSNLKVLQSFAIKKLLPFERHYWGKTGSGFFLAHPYPE